MKKILALPLAAVAACTAQPPHEPVVAADSSGPRCIDLRMVGGRQPLPPSSVLFDTTNGSFRVDLAGRCAERATATSIVQTESQSTQLCRDDRIRIYDPTEAKGTSPRAFPQCRVVNIVPVPHS